MGLVVLSWAGLFWLDWGCFGLAGVVLAWFVFDLCIVLALSVLAWCWLVFLGLAWLGMSGLVLVRLALALVCFRVPFSVIPLLFLWGE